MARKYITHSLGPLFAEPVVLNLEATWMESEPRTPLVCLLSMGSDPTNQIEALSKRVTLPFGAISMGQGQEIPARSLIRSSLENVRFQDASNCPTSTYCSIFFSLLRVDGYCCRTAI